MATENRTYSQMRADANGTSLKWRNYRFIFKRELLFLGRFGYVVTDRDMNTVLGFVNQRRYDSSWMAFCYVSKPKYGHRVHRIYFKSRIEAAESLYEKVFGETSTYVKKGMLRMNPWATKKRSDRTTDDRAWVVRDLEWAHEKKARELRREVAQFYLDGTFPENRRKIVELEWEAKKYDRRAASARCRYKKLKEQSFLPAC